MKKQLAFCMPLLFAVLAAACSQAEKETVRYTPDYPHYESVDALASRTSDIVAGKITEVRTEAIDISSGGANTGQTSMVYTVYTLDVESVYKGHYKTGEPAEVKLLGKTPALGLRVGTEYLFFLESYDAVPASLLNPYQCVYFYSKEAAVLDSVSGENSLTLTRESLNGIRPT